MIFADREVTRGKKKEGPSNVQSQNVLLLWTDNGQNNPRKQLFDRCQMWRKLLWIVVMVPRNAIIISPLLLWQHLRIIMSTLFLAVYLTGCMEVVVAEAQAAEPFWKVGRVKIEQQMDSNGRKLMVLKLSLRNEGKPGTADVTIMGRWGQSMQPPEGEMKKLGLYTQEVALKKTAILTVSLESLGAVPPEKPLLELIIITNSNETDRQIITVPQF